MKEKNKKKTINLGKTRPELSERIDEVRMLMEGLNYGESVYVLETVKAVLIAHRVVDIVKENN